MQWTATFTSCLSVRSRNFHKYLLLLCLVTFLGLLVARKDQIIHRISQNVQAPYRYVEQLFDYSEESPEETTKQMDSDIMSSKVTIKPHILTSKSPNLTTKQLKPKSEHPTTKAKVLLVTNKTSKVTTTSPLKTTLALKATSKPSSPGSTKAKITPTTPSFLGDKYEIDNTHLNSSCPNRIRDKLKGPEFNDTFVETIPVLQWQKHATESEYRRLQLYGGVYGWMGVTWQIVNETLHLMNSSKSGYMFDSWKGDRPCIRCAVVGNGGILNGSGMGAEIDGHDYVFRVNGAITNGYEKDVGNRTSFFGFSTNTMMNSLAAYGRHGFKKVPRTEETQYLILPDHDRDYLIVRAALTNSIIDRGHDKSRRPSDFFGDNLRTEHFKILHPDFMRYLRSRFLWSPILNTKNRGIYRPSTGASMLLAAVHTCDQVDAYGFITPNYSKFSDHYFDKKYNKVIFYSNHSFRKEMELWQRLHKAGVIKLLMRD
ncbi:alpha-N-acetylgalactosaminide alpha-2,6-sialyltransferase 2-like [Discoglossus pictus]